MDNIFQYIINLIIFVPVTIALIIISIRLSRANLGSMGSYKYINILERTNLNKDTDVFILKIGDEGCVLLSSPSNVEKIKELSKDEINNIEELRKEPKAKLVNLSNKLNLHSLNLKEINLNKLKSKENRYGKLR